MFPQVEVSHNPTTQSTPRNAVTGAGFDRVPGAADKIGYARVSTADQNPQLQLDALATEDCPKVYTDRASGTTVDRPRWNLCLADLRAGDTLIIWRIDRLGRKLRDLIDIVTTLQARGVGVRSPTNGLGRHHHRARRPRVRHVRPHGRVRAPPAPSHP